MANTISEQKLLILLLDIKKISKGTITTFGNHLRKGEMQDEDFELLQEVIKKMYFKIEESKELTTNIIELKAAAGA